MRYLHLCRFEVAPIQFNAPSGLLGGTRRKRKRGHNDMSQRKNVTFTNYFGCNFGLLELDDWATITAQIAAFRDYQNRKYDM